MKKVSRVTELMIKASDRAAKIGDDKLVKMLQEMKELHFNVENKIWQIHEAMETIKRYR
jgi:predicted urease superfamily metal-dependent hydrolase